MIRVRVRVRYVISVRIMKRARVRDMVSFKFRVREIGV